MNIKFKFIDSNTVSIEVTMPWLHPRPAPDDRRTIKKDVFINRFRKKYPTHQIEKVEGPEDVCNFREQERSHGIWTLTVSKKQNSAPKREAPAQVDPPEKLKKRLIKTKKGA